MKSFFWLTSILAVIFSPVLLIHAGELKLLDEYRYEADSCFFKKMDPNRFILVGYVSDRGEPGQPLGLQYEMFDMKKREFTNISLPVGEFQKKFPALLGTKAGLQLEAYNGEISSLIMNQVSNYKTVAWYYCQYDHAKKQISESVKMGDRKESNRYPQNHESSRAGDRGVRGALPAHQGAHLVLLRTILHQSVSGVLPAA